MNTEVKAQWIAALRSGKYEQGKNYLNKNNKFCCLGVLCELAVKADITTKFESDEEDSATVYAYSYNTYLPNTVRDWAGLDASIPYIPSMKVSVAYLNDVYDYTFEQLADIIEREL